MGISPPPRASHPFTPCAVSEVVGTVYHYFEKPDAAYCFKHATCWLPDYRWEDICHFDQKDINRFQEIIESTAHLIMEFSKKEDLKVSQVLKQERTGYISGQMKVSPWSRYTSI